jgi:hypothetical protein
MLSSIGPFPAMSRSDVSIVIDCCAMLEVTQVMDQPTRRTGSEAKTLEALMAKLQGLRRLMQELYPDITAAVVH